MGRKQTNVELVEGPNGASIDLTGVVPRIAGYPLLTEGSPLRPFFQKLEFEPVEEIIIPYGQLPVRPSVEVWVDNPNGGYDQASPGLYYDETNEILTISFNGNFESGYLILR